MVVTDVVSSASLRAGRLGVGSLATLRGSRLGGKAVQVTFDDIPAPLLYVDEKQIDLQIPPELGSRASAKMIVTVDGVKSDPFIVELAPLSPEIFPSRTLNQDNTVNQPASPAKAGEVVQMFLTGLTPPPA